MKNVIIVTLLVGCVVCSGCLSVYNHSRVKESVIKSRIVASGNQEQIKMLNAGVKPSDAVKVIPIANGAVMAVNLFDIEGLSSYFTTYAEAPVSSTAALLGDLGTATVAGKYIYDNVFDNSRDNSKQSDKSTTGNENNDISLDNVNVSGDLEININSENSYAPAE